MGDQGSYFGPSSMMMGGMSIRDFTTWVRETFMDVLDAKVKELDQDPLAGIGLDEINLLERERDRVGKFLGLKKEGGSWKKL